MPASETYQLKILVSAQDQATKTVKGLQDNLEKTSKSVSSLAKDLSVGIGIPLVALSAGIGKFASEASKFEAVRSSFETMTRGMVGSTNEFLGAMKDATVGTLSNYEILTSANRALSLIGQEAFGDFQTDFANMAEYVRKASRATGYDVSYLWDSLIMGVGRGSKMILDNLGITVSLTEAQDAWAKKLGKASDELTEQEKKAALLNYTLGLLDDRYGEVSIEGATTAEKMAAVKASFSDLVSDIGEKFIPVVNNVIDAFQKIWSEHGPKVIEMAEKMADAFGKLDPKLTLVAVGLAGILTALTPLAILLPHWISLFNTLKGVMIGLATALGITKAALLSFVAGAALIVGIIAGVGAVVALFVSLDKNLSNFVDSVGGFKNALVLTFRHIEIVILEWAYKFLEAMKSVLRFSPTLSAGIERDMERIGRALDKAREDFDNMAVGMMNARLEAIEMAQTMEKCYGNICYMIDKTTGTLKEFTREVDRAGGSGSGAGDDIAKAMEKAKKTIDELQNSIKGVRDKIIQTLADIEDRLWGMADEEVSALQQVIDMNREKIDILKGGAGEMSEASKMEIEDLKKLIEAREDELETLTAVAGAGGAPEETYRKISEYSKEIERAQARIKEIQKEGAGEILSTAEISKRASELEDAMAPYLKEIEKAEARIEEIKMGKKIRPVGEVTEWATGVKATLEQRIAGPGFRLAPPELVYPRLQPITMTPTQAVKNFIFHLEGSLITDPESFKQGIIDAINRQNDLSEQGT